MPRKDTPLAATRAPLPIMLLSLGSYLSFVSIGLRIFTVPWAHALDETTAMIVCIAIPAFVLQYVVESALAYSMGIVTMYTWHPREVVQHHLSAASLLLPMMLLHFVWAPAEWSHFVTHHTPLTAIACSGFLTGLNEALFVMRSLIPVSLAEAPHTKTLQRTITLCVLGVNMPMMLASCAVSFLPQQRAMLAMCTSGSCGAFGEVRRALVLVSYIGAALFTIVLQRSYVMSNLRHLGIIGGVGLPPATYSEDKGKCD